MLNEYWVKDIFSLGQMNSYALNSQHRQYAGESCWVSITCGVNELNDD